MVFADVMVALGSAAAVRLSQVAPNAGKHQASNVIKTIQANTFRPNFRDMICDPLAKPTFQLCRPTRHHQG
jgi:hypothetical protein